MSKDRPLYEMFAAALDSIHVDRPGVCSTCQSKLDENGDCKRHFCQDSDYSWQKCSQCGFDEWLNIYRDDMCKRCRNRLGKE